MIGKDKLRKGVLRFGGSSLMVLGVISCSVTVPKQEGKGALHELEGVYVPDYSYAGYGYGVTDPKSDGKVFSVIDYGANPDDNIVDDEGIAKAIDASKASGEKAVIYIPQGEYLITKPIFIRHGNITLKGDGSDKTILRVESSLVEQESQPAEMDEVKAYLKGKEVTINYETKLGFKS